VNDILMIIEVACNLGEESISINNVSDLDISVLEPMLIDIKNHRGYYPTGSYIRPGQPTARDLYRSYQAWDIFESLIPKPRSGFSTILSIKLFKEKPLEMDML
jgi:hypothetical protein